MLDDDCVHPEPPECFHSNRTCIGDRWLDRCAIRRRHSMRASNWYKLYLFKNINSQQRPARSPSTVAASECFTRNPPLRVHCCTARLISNAHTRYLPTRPYVVIGTRRSAPEDCVRSLIGRAIVRPGHTCFASSENAPFFLSLLIPPRQADGLRVAILT